MRGWASGCEAVRKNDRLPWEAGRVMTGSVGSTGEEVYLRSTVTLRARLWLKRRD